MFFKIGRNSFLRLIDDETYLKLLFKTNLGYNLNLDNSHTFNEKLQWLKIHDRKPIYSKMVDKIEVKKIVESIIGKEYIIPTLGVWDKVDDIDFDRLPKQFVLKCSHDSGGLVIYRDKRLLDIERTKDSLKKCMKQNFYWVGREWPYKNVKPRVLAEQYMEDYNENNVDLTRGLVDYKFFCFNGIPNLLYVSKGLENHSTAQISFYGMDGIEKEFHRSDYKPYHNAIMPINLEEMIIIAEKLARKVDSPFVRIDLYSINGKIYFSEITFSPCSGMIPFDPPYFDLTLGNELVLPI